jgi:hypothetical protein
VCAERRELVRDATTNTAAAARDDGNLAFEEIRSKDASVGHRLQVRRHEEIGEEGGARGDGVMVEVGDATRAEEGLVEELLARANIAVAPARIVDVLFPEIIVQ